MKECITVLYMVTLVSGGGVEYRYFYTRTRAARFTKAYGGSYQKVYAMSPEPLYYTDTRSGLTLEQLADDEQVTVQLAY